ncbi:MAG: DNA polymerase III subunit gamma/tau [Muribaculaceae bacterium]|nr:DNA polymerase III subunit gamma/tau [Muribaculaceae bacterium]
MSDQYIVSARKYRPATFKSVVGQPNLTATLKGAISSGRLAHAYLFCGPRGVGKTSCARIFAKTINCLNPTADGEACGECESCKAIEKGSSFNLMELDAASNNGVDHIRAINEQVNIPPQVGKYKVFIIDEVHMLSSGAFNAFLKTLEEPPAYAIFILATTEKHKVLPTILSRCQIYDFKRITITDIVDHLAYVAGQEGIDADRRALGVIARKADGAMRDALSIFDQVATSTAGKMTYDATVANLNVLDYDYFFRLMDMFAAGDTASALLLYKDVRDRGFDSLFFVNSLAQHVRDLMVAADPRTVPLLETSDDVSKRLVEQAGSLPLKWYFQAIRILNDTDLNYRTSSNKQLLVELALIRLSQLNSPADGPFEGPERIQALRAPAVAQGTPKTSGQSAATVKSANPAPPVSQTTAPSRSVMQTSGATPTQPAASAAVKARSGRRPSSFSLADADKEASASQRHRCEQYTDEQFADVWREYALKVSDKMMLASALRAGIPAKTGTAPYDYTLMVSGVPQLNAFTAGAQPLVEFLRDRLSNDSISVHAALDPEVAKIKKLNPAELLAKAVKDNPELKNFLQAIDAELADL